MADVQLFNTTDSLGERDVLQPGGNGSNPKGKLLAVAAASLLIGIVGTVLVHKSGDIGALQYFNPSSVQTPTGVQAQVHASLQSGLRAGRAVPVRLQGPVQAAYPGGEPRTSADNVAARIQVRLPFFY